MVRVIDAEGKQLGILDIKKALEIADDQGYDLVEVSPNADPPVCRLMDYGKYKYQLSKKLQKKKSSHTVHTKEIKLRPFTGQHDLEVKLRHILEFLDRGNKVKITVVFRGRELRFKEHGENILKKIMEEISENGIVESAIKMEGRNMVMMIAPKKKI
jgi:translation initiation factor IF-3